MKFDVIVGNPPYQKETMGHGKQAKPIYHLFVEQAVALNPKHIAMITPSRWFTGGMGLSKFRSNMMSDKRIKTIVDFPNSKDCFPGVSISGGVNYFHWDRAYLGKCQFTSISNKHKKSFDMTLDEYEMVIRFKESREIIKAIDSVTSKKMSEEVSSINVFDLPSSFRGSENPSSSSDIKVLHSKGFGYLSKKIFDSKNIQNDLLDKYKVVVSRTVAEHANEPSKDGTFKVIAKSLILSPGEVCTHSYLVLASFNNKEEADNCLAYIQTKTCRFLILQTLTGIDLSALRFAFVPLIDFSSLVTDEILYKRYSFSEEDIMFIENIIRPMYRV